LNGPRLRQIDEQSRADHVRLAPDDACYFLYEYTSGQGYSFSATNSLISNLKKKLGTTGYQYKLQAITHSARELANAINSEWLDAQTNRRTARPSLISFGYGRSTNSLRTHHLAGLASLTTC
jgi:hypothetical protein